MQMRRLDVCELIPADGGKYGQFELARFSYINGYGVASSINHLY